MAHRNQDSRATLHSLTTLPAVVAPKLDPAKACLVVIYGDDLGKRVALEAGDIECGRSLATDVPLDDDAVSRKHARFSWTGAGFAVSDLGSTNGTFVNDRSIQDAALHDGDQIKIGHTIFKFITGSNVELAYHEEIYRLMTFDGLTQAHNKRAYQTAVEREVSRCLRYDRPLSLALFDIDLFKHVNDERGHLAGDAVLRQLSALVKANLRREDVLARVGGEEFAVLLPEVPLASARLVAEKLRALVEGTPARYEDVAIPFTASFGVAELAHDPPMTAEELYAAADARLYAAKWGGRNRVE